MTFKASTRTNGERKNIKNKTRFKQLTLKFISNEQKCPDILP